MRIAHWTAVAWWIMPVLFALLLAIPTVTLPGDDLGIRRFHTPPLSGDIKIGQTFTMTAGGLHAIEVFPAVVGRHLSGDVRFVLWDFTDETSPIPVREVEVMAADLTKAPSYRFEFLPVLDSKDRDYRFDVTSAAAEGVAFWATKGERYDGGSLRINDQDRWADLAFRVYAPAPSVWRLLMNLRETNPLRAYIVIAALAAIWLLVGIVLRELSEMSTGPGRLDSPRAA